MSGSSLNYLCFQDEAGEIMQRAWAIEEVRFHLLRLKDKADVSTALKHVEFLLSLKNEIEREARLLKGVFRAVEWELSSDTCEEDTIATLKDFNKNYPLGEWR